MFTVTLYALAIAFLIYSYSKDKGKTKRGIMKAWKSFYNLLPAFSGVLALVGLALTFLSPQIITTIIGKDTGILGMLITAIVGSITLIPAFVAFPLASSLLDVGAGISQMAVFVSTLMMVGIVTMPLEIKYFGKREAILRNSFSFAYSFLVAWIIGVVLIWL